jgi:predicted XRE-type DNA-binding protein
MSEKLELVRGSGNVFRDFGHENADLEQLRAILAAEIIKALDREGLSVRSAHGRTGIAAADFSRIRNADLGRFTIDRLMSIINRLGSRVEVRIRVRRARTTTQVRPRRGGSSCPAQRERRSDSARRGRPATHPSAPSPHQESQTLETQHSRSVGAEDRGAAGILRSD